MSGFTPTCPRCSILCAPGSRHCVECGCRLYLTQRELDELHGYGLQEMTVALWGRLPWLEPL